MIHKNYMCINPVNFFLQPKSVIKFLFLFFCFVSYITLLFFYLSFPHSLSLSTNVLIFLFTLFVFFLCIYLSNFFFLKVAFCDFYNRDVNYTLNSHQKGRKDRKALLPYSQHHHHQLQQHLMYSD